MILRRGRQLSRKPSSASLGNSLLHRGKSESLRRTSPGTKLTTLLHHPWCAFETDDVRDLFEWDSVAVKGTFYLLDPEKGSPDTYRRAHRLLQKLVPGTFSAHDPTPHRDFLFGIFVHEISGRSARR